MKINPAAQAYLNQIQKHNGVNGNEKADFGTMLKDALNRVNELQVRSR